MRGAELLIPRPEGLYCPPGDFFIDPTRPVARALVTHAHSDHATAGHGAVAGAGVIGVAVSNNCAVYRAQGIDMKAAWLAEQARGVGPQPSLEFCGRGHAFPLLEAPAPRRGWRKGPVCRRPY